MPGVFPDYPAPVIRNTEGGREMAMMRWGMPTPPRTGGPPFTNIRNTSSPHWRIWLKPENRCLVPANSFAEYAPEPNPETKKKDVVWFALSEERPLFAFAGISASFVVNGAAQAADSVLTTASLEMKWMDGWSAAATFEGEFSNVTASYAGKGVVRYAW
jgi:putative SOS response-associated peptidase YedK